MTREELGDVLGVPADDVKAWEEGAPVPEQHLFPLVRWLETGYVPDAGDTVPSRDAYPWVIDPRA